MKKHIPQLFIILVVGYLLFLIRPAIFGQLGGTFQPHKIPQEYIQLGLFLQQKKQFSRTLWIPSVQRFGFTSFEHPAVSAEDFFHVSSVSGVLDMLQKSSTESLLQQAGIAYVVVPYDSEKEIFIKDRKYDNALYIQTAREVGAIPWLRRVPEFNNIIVFQISHPKDHFYLLRQGSISYTSINPTEYKVRLQNVSKGERLVFSESYNTYWVMQEGNIKQGSQKYNSLFNSFILPKDGSYIVTIFYTPQQWVVIGLWISDLTTIGVAVYLVWFLKVNVLK